MLTLQERLEDILGSFYHPEAIYLREITAYVPDQMSMTARFTVPRLPSYTLQPMDYVTAEQYVRCLSQLSYVLMGTLIAEGVLNFGLHDYTAFKQLMVECKLYYLHTNLSYRRKMAREEPFELTLRLISTGSLRRHPSCTLQISGVIRGELQYVAVE